MNKRGSVMLVWFMVGIMFFVFGLAIASPLGTTTKQSMDDPMLNCSTTTDDQTKAVCTQIDLYQPLYVGLMFGLAGLLIGRVLTG